VTWSLRKARILIEVAPEAIESVQQLADTWRATVIDRGPGDVRDLPGAAIRWADSKFPFWNCITFNDQGANSQLLDERLTQAVAYMRQKSQPRLICCSKTFSIHRRPTGRAGGECRGWRPSRTAGALSPMESGRKADRQPGPIRRRHEICQKEALDETAQLAGIPGNG
jgi:hypothetical protein